MLSLFAIALLWTTNAGPAPLVPAAGQLNISKRAPVQLFSVGEGGITQLKSGVGCYTLTDESECLSSADGRDDWAGQLCAWCCGESCIPDVNDQKCQPVGWLESTGTNHYHHNGEHKTEKANSCPCPSPLTESRLHNKCCKINHIITYGGGECCKHPQTKMFGRTCEGPEKVVVAAGVNGEDYCESEAMIQNEVGCQTSSCCHWNTHEAGDASFNGAGRCWSSIGTDLCHDTACEDDPTWRRTQTRLELDISCSEYESGMNRHRYCSFDKDNSGVRAKDACRLACGTCTVG